MCVFVYNIFNGSLLRCSFRRLLKLSRALDPPLPPPSTLLSIYKSKLQPGEIYHRDLRVVKGSGVKGYNDNLLPISRVVYVWMHIMKSSLEIFRCDNPSCATVIL